MNTVKTILYRVIAIMTNDFGVYNQTGDRKVDESTKWEGTDLNELSRKFPPSSIHGADPLGHSEIEDGLIRYDYRFEQQLDDGSWETISDPRRRITPVTSLERAIDEENRRLYPGDFITSDDDDDYDDGPNCTSCDDRGCEKCMPNATCKLCFDDGCSVCEPECAVCRSLLRESEKAQGLCSSCQKAYEDFLVPVCAKCEHTTVDNDGDICYHCDDTKCSTCAHDLASGLELQMGLCMSCADFYGIYDDCWLLWAADVFDGCLVLGQPSTGITV